MSCIFCRIAAGEIPAKKVLENDQVVAFHDLDKILRNGEGERVAVRVELPSEGNASTTIRLYSVDRVPALSSILPALHNAGVAIERESAQARRNGEHALGLLAARRSEHVHGSPEPSAPCG